MKILQTIIYIFIFVLIIGSPILTYILLNKKKYKCDSTGSCLQDPSGKYTTLKKCQDTCVPTKRYECKYTQCIENSSGNYSSLDECQSHCGETITFYFEDGTSEKFPYFIKLKYFTQRGVQTGCYDELINQKNADETTFFKMTNQNPPIKFEITKIPDKNYLFMFGYDWNVSPYSKPSCGEFNIQLRPGQNLKKLGPTDDISNKIWQNSFNYFGTKIVM